jgi:hypothetical protein
MAEPLHIHQILPTVMRQIRERMPLRNRRDSSGPNDTNLPHREHGEASGLRKSAQKSCSRPVSCSILRGDQIKPEYWCLASAREEESCAFPLL